MQLCPVCGFKSLHDERLVDESGIDRGSRTVCTKCGHVDRENLDLPAGPRRRPGRRRTCGG
jgi:uncharacterized Zn finger protein